MLPTWDNRLRLPDIECQTPSYTENLNEN